jgi:predicted nucleic acid-binding protein
MAVKLLTIKLAGEKIIVSTQVLSEFYSAMSKYKRSHEEISCFLGDIIQCANVIGISLPTFEFSLKLKERYGYSFWDSLILAAAMESGCENLYSEDMQHGRIIEGSLIIQNPFYSAIDNF